MGKIQCLNTIQCLKIRKYFMTFIILLLWPSMAQGGIPKQLLSKLSNKVSSKKEFRNTVNRLMDDLDMQQSISENDLAIFARAFDDPMELIDDNLQSVSGNNTDGFIRTSYNMGGSQTYLIDDSSDLYKLYEAFFFSRFDLKVHGESFFSKFFPRQTGGIDTFMGKLENFFKAAEQAKQRGYTQIDSVDLAAATITILCRHDYSGAVLSPNTWPRTLLKPKVIGFFESQFRYVDYYMSPYFTLSPRTEYSQQIIDRILSDKSNLHTEEVFLKLWEDIELSKILEEDSLHYMGTSYNKRISILGEYLEDSIEEVVRFRAVRTIEEYMDLVEKSPFFRTLMEAGREDTSLYRIVNEVIEDFYQSNFDQSNRILYYPHRPSADHLVGDVVW